MLRAMNRWAAALILVAAMCIIFYAGYRTRDDIPARIEQQIQISLEQKPIDTAAAPQIARGQKSRPAPPAAETRVEIPSTNPPQDNAGRKPVVVPEKDPGESAGEPVLPPTTVEGPLKISYPKPMYVGTPVPIRLINLEPPRAAGPWEFTVPAGTVNLARSRPVTASDTSPLLGSLDLITDGDKSADEGSYVELAGGCQWVQIDLGRPASISCVVVWHYHMQARAYKAVVVQLCDDPGFASDVTTIFNNDIDNLCGLGAGKDFAYVESNFGKLMDTKGSKGRYVRLYSNGNTSNGMNHYIEVEVYGQ